MVHTISDLSVCTTAQCQAPLFTKPEIDTESAKALLVTASLVGKCPGSRVLLLCIRRSPHQSLAATQCKGVLRLLRWFFRPGYTVYSPYVHTYCACIYIHMYICV